MLLRPLGPPCPPGKGLPKPTLWIFLDLDDILEEKGRKVSQIVQEEGWEGFRQLESEVLADALAKHGEYAVISCGGGVVETESCRTLLKSHWPVLHFKRSIDDIIKVLEPEDATQTATERRPNYGESIRDVWKRRRPWFANSSTHRFTVVKGDENWETITNEFLHFVQKITRNTALKTGKQHLSPYRSFVCLTFPDLTEAAKDGTLRQLCAGGEDGGDSVELRVDLLRSYDGKSGAKKKI